MPWESGFSDFEAAEDFLDIIFNDKAIDKVKGLHDKVDEQVPLLEWLEEQEQIDLPAI